MSSGAWPKVCEVCALLGVASALAMFAGPALAHHSTAMFDQDRTVTLTGTVRQFSWANPHSWLTLVVSDPAGKVAWKIEMGSTSVLFRAGWSKTSVHVGEPLVVEIHPLRDGKIGGFFLSAKGEDGKVIGETP